MPERDKAKLIVALYKAQARVKRINISAIASNPLVELSRTQVYRVLRAAKLVAPAKKRVQGKSK